MKELYGGPGSGNFGHAGRPGEVGGSDSESINKIHSISKLLIERDNIENSIKNTKDFKKVEELKGKAKLLDSRAEQILTEAHNEVTDKENWLKSARSRGSAYEYDKALKAKVEADKNYNIIKGTFSSYKLKYAELPGLKECYGAIKEKTPEAFLFAEIKDTKRIFVAREAPLKHRRGITRQDILDIKKNFEEQAIGRDVDIDYEHKNGSRGGQAAGWLKSLEMVEENGKLTLYGVPEYTPDAEKATSEKVYKYTSPEIHFGWQHPENGKKYSAVLKSLALLNNPQLIGQPAVQAMYSEIYKKVEV